VGQVHRRPGVHHPEPLPLVGLFRHAAHILLDSVGMKKNRLPVSILIVLLILTATLAACRGKQEPVQVFVTATPASSVAVMSPDGAASPTMPGPTAEPMAVAAALTLPTATPSPTFPPGVTFGPIAGPGPSTLAPSETSFPPTIQPGVTYGPIIGPGYTLPPTQPRVPPTPLPTVAPTAGPSPTPGPALRRDLLGIQIHPYIDRGEFDRALGYVSDLGFPWIKFQANWSLLESGPGQYTELLYILRLYIQQAHSQGFRVMISVAKAPGWARTPDPDGVMREDGPPDDPQALARFLSGMLNMLGMDVDGSSYISAIEVWNEPNLKREWHNHPLTGDDYMRYFRPAYDAIRQFSPAITIITAAPAPTGDSQGSTNDRNWLQQLYGAGLAQYGQDVAVGVHPYGWANPPDARCCANPSRGWDDQPQFFFLNTIEDYHQIMVARGHSGAQLWATEFGWATFDGLRTSKGSQPLDPPDTPYFNFINQGQEAQYTLRAFQIAQQLPYMGPMILWNLNFATLPGAVDKSDPQAAYGLLDSNWQPRLIYQTLKQAPKN
jgi:hypothetical protein